MRIIFTCILMSLSLPVEVTAAVIINEIAWMGSAASANHEWIELYNTGTNDMVLDGWNLLDGASLKIPLSGTVAALSYAVLERTSENSAPGAAFLLYTGALVNTGATLTLYDGSGAIMDRTAGGEGWSQIGGDNISKETAQYTTRGWVTGTPTPGQVNQTGSEISPEPPPQNETSSTTSTASAGSGNTLRPRSANDTVRLVALDTVLTLKPDLQSIAYVNQTISMKIMATGVGDTIKNSLEYTWNFGDTYVDTGKEVTHRYEYPGTYVITIRGAYARHDTTVRQEITVLPVTFSITRNEVGDVQLHNDAPYDVDLSGYTVVGEESVTFPLNSIMVPRGTVTIASSRLEPNVGASLLHVYDEYNKLVTTSESSEKENKPVVQTSLSLKPTPSNPVAVATLPAVDPLEATEFTFATTVSTNPETRIIAGLTLSHGDQIESQLDEILPAGVQPNKGQTWPYTALLGLFIVILGVIFSYPKRPL